MDVVFAMTLQAEAEVVKAADVAAEAERAAADLAEIENEETQE